MKLRPKFFNGTAFRKDITRFAPLWALYLIGGLMIALSVMSDTYGEDDWFTAVENAQSLSTFIGTFGVINIVYAMLCAQVLCGDIFNGKLCNALHAMPLRRESWFLTHVAAGLLFSLVPNTVLALAIMPYLSNMWFTALLWLLGMQLHFLFFFGLAVFSMHCTGSRFASIVVYLILNFFSLLVFWFASTMYEPLIYGVEWDSQPFLRFCPVAWLLMEPDYFELTIADPPPGHTSSLPQLGPSTYWGGLGESWGYLTVLAVLGVVFLVLALLLYRARKLESAGDFVAFKAMRPIFWVLFALCAGGTVQLIGVGILGLSDEGGYIFLGLGLICGYFVAQMLIARSAKVFKKRNFLYLGIFLGAFVLSLVFTGLDLLGIGRYAPAADSVEQVYISDYRLVDWDLTRLEQGLPNRYGSLYRGDSREEIETVRRLHGNLYEDGLGNRNRQPVYITYVMKNGSVIRRHYSPDQNSAAYRELWELMSSPQNIFHWDTLEELKQNVPTVYVNGYVVSSRDRESLLEAVWLDGATGALYDNGDYHAITHGEQSDSGNHVELVFTAGNAQVLRLYPCCKNTLEWVKKYRESVSIFKDDIDVLLENIDFIDTSAETVTDAWELRELLSLLYKDLKLGTAVPAVTDDPAGAAQCIHIRLRTDTIETVYLLDGSLTWEYILDKML